MISKARHAIFILLPERSSFNGSFKLAKELRLAGFEVTYIGPPTYRDFVTVQGLGYAALLPDPILPQIPHDRLRGLMRWWRRLRAAQSAFDGYIAGLSAAIGELEQWIGDHQPSVALLEPMMWEFSPPLLRAKIPTIGLSNTLTARFDTHFPPVFSATVAIDEPSLWVRLSYSMEWSVVALRFAMQYVLESVQLLACAGPGAYAVLSPRARVRRSGGRLCLGEYGFRLRVPELILAPKEIDFPQTASQPDRHYAGSCVDIERKDVALEWGQIDKTHDLVYCSLGTYNQFYPETVHLFRAVIEAILLEPGLQAIIQVGSTSLIEELGPQSARVRLVEQAPQLEILRHACVFITHGGIGAVREGLFLGVPMIVFPCWLDQPGNAARLVYHGVAVTGNRSSADAELVHRLLVQARSPEIRRAVERMRDSFRKQEPCQNGVGWIESVVHGSSHQV